jgi:hypothetical protein
VVVPYAHGPYTAGLHPEVVAALEADGYAPETVDVSGSETAYHDLLAGLWREGRTLIVVEHDVVVYPGALAAMLACPEPWCVTPYRVNGEYEGYLGCVRFSARLLAEVPDAMDAAGQLTYGPPPRYWGWIDNRLAQVLGEHGYSKHRHWPAVKHLHVYDPPTVWNCVCGRPIPEETVASGPGPWRCGTCGTR